MGARSGQPAVHVGQAAPGPDRRDRGAQPAVRRGGVVHVVAGHGGETGVGGEPGQRVVAGRVGRSALVDQLDQHLVAAEPGGQPVQRLGRGGGPVEVEGRADRTLAAAGEDEPVAVGLLGQLVQVVERPALLVPAQLGLGDRRGQPVVALHSRGEHQQMLALRVGHPVLRLGQAEGQLGAVDRAQRVRGRRLGEPGRGVEAVVVGDGQRVQAQPDRLLDQLLRVVHPVEEAEVAVAVQLGVGHGRRLRRLHQLLGDCRVRGSPVGVARRAVPLGVRGRPVAGRPAGDLPLQLGPGDVRVEPAHPYVRSARAHPRSCRAEPSSCRLLQKI